MLDTHKQFHHWVSFSADRTKAMSVLLDEQVAALRLRQRQQQLDCEGDSEVSGNGLLCLPSTLTEEGLRVQSSPYIDCGIGNSNDRWVPSLQRQHRRCWSMFLGVSCALASIVVVAVTLLILRDHRQHQDLRSSGSAPPTPRHHSLEYFLLCVIGGVLSGIPHVLMTPVDIVKCRIQVGEHRSIRSGLSALRKEATQAMSPHLPVKSLRSVLHTLLAFLRVMYLGWLPTLIGYCLQGALKFGFYEYFRYRFAVAIPFDLLLAYLTWIFVVASACAEIIADIALAPWETVKVRMQTHRTSSGGSSTCTSLRELMPTIWFSEGGLGAFFRCLVPLWCRQVPYTVVKFTTFEKSVVLIRWVLHGKEGRHAVPIAGGERFVVALLAGYVAGTLCAIVSQPADVVVSRLTAAQGETRGSEKKHTWWTVVNEIGFRGLWKGLSARVLLVGTLSGAQWAIYDGFKMLSGAG